MRNLQTTQDQNFYRELILKEDCTRLAWKMKYSKEYASTFTSHRSKSKSIGLFNPPSVGKVTLPPVVQTRETRERPEKPDRRSLSEAPLMRPASPRTTAALYRGLSNEGKGRSLYLKKRAQKDPEEKFDHPILSSWDYGWRLGEQSGIYTHAHTQHARTHTHAHTLNTHKHTHFLNQCLIFRGMNFVSWFYLVK